MGEGGGESYVGVRFAGTVSQESLIYKMMIDKLVRCFP